MSAKIKDIMDIVHDAIETAKEAQGYINNGFLLLKDFCPITSLPNIPTSGQIIVIGMAGDDLRGSRGKFFTREVPVRIAIQKKITDIHDVDEICPWCELEDQIRDTVADSSTDPNIFWLRHESLKDENDTPFNYIKMREASVFETYFDAYFKLTLTR